MKANTKPCVFYNGTKLLMVPNGRHIHIEDCWHCKPKQANGRR